MKKVTAEWIAKAENDFLAAQDMLQKRPLRKNRICFCCQQAIEKYLKAMLQELGLAIPRTHDIPRLIDLLRTNDKTWRSLRRGTKSLTRYAVEYRYPGLDATARQARAAFAKAGRFRQELARRLGFRPRKK